MTTRVNNLVRRNKPSLTGLNYTAMNLIEGLQYEMNRCRELLKMYESIPQGVFGATVIKQSIKEAEEAINNGDTVQMMACYEQLKSHE